MGFYRWKILWRFNKGLSMHCMVLLQYFRGVLTSTYPRLSRLSPAKLWAQVATTTAIHEGSENSGTHAKYVIHCFDRLYFVHILILTHSF